MNKQYFIKSVSNTEELAYELARTTKAGDIYALIGDLGTGKTTFTKAFASMLGVRESVGSPTFKLISEYEGTNLWVYHIDCYRLNNAQQFINIGGEEYLQNSNGVTLIEWADIIEEILPQNTIYIFIDRVKENPNYRKIIIKSNQ